MTLIHVRCTCGTCQEWVLIELQVRCVMRVPARSARALSFRVQGEIERSDGEAVLDSLEVGTLCKAATVRRVCAAPRSHLRAGAARHACWRENRRCLTSLANVAWHTLALDTLWQTQGVLKLTVGYHEVEGKLGALKKPLVVLRRVEGDGTGEPAYEAVGVIRKKFHFKNRPKALITAAEPGKRMKSATRDTARAFFGKAAQ